jgi:hypothetical protein
VLVRCLATDNERAASRAADELRLAGADCRPEQPDAWVGSPLLLLLNANPVEAARCDSTNWSQQGAKLRN